MIVRSNQAFVGKAVALQSPFSMPSVQKRGKIWAFNNEIIERRDTRVLVHDSKPCIDTDPKFFTLKEGGAQAPAMFPVLCRFGQLWDRHAPANLSKDSSR